MDYEKKYKEALERAKRFMSIRGVSPEEDPFVVAKELCEEIFPELAESEDKRIRKALLEMVSDIDGGWPFEKHRITKKEAIAYLEKQKEQKHPDGCFTCDEYKKGYEAGRLNGLTAGYNKTMKEQKPAEWSEEDEAMIKSILFVLESYVSQSESASSPSLITSYPTYYKEIDWLKSLRPQSRKEIYQAAKHDLAIKFMNYLDENRPEGKMSLSNGECEDIDKAFKENDWAKIRQYIEKYSSHWKPSEEQMDALRVTLEYMPDTFKPRCTLETLQNDLKKHM